MTDSPSPSDATDCQPDSGDQPFNDRSEVIFLGTGTSVGVPAIGCDCEVCLSDDPRNNRTRCSILFRLPAGNLLIDTSPDLRHQLLREKIPLVHAVAYTHEHADHVFGLDDVRLFPFRLGKPVPLYCRSDVEARIRKSFDYAFTDREQTHPGAIPQLTFERIDERPFEVLGVGVTPIPLKHGPRFEVLGFRIGNFAYCTDASHIPESSMALLQGLDTFVVGALRDRPHITHFNVEQAIEVTEKLNPRQAFFTHMCHELDHQPTCDRLPAGIDLAYDGLRLALPGLRAGNWGSAS